MKIVQRDIQGYRSLLSWVLLCQLIMVAKAAPTQTAPATSRYAITDLGTLPGGDHSAAYGINNKGQIVGWSDAGKDNIFESAGDSFLDSKRDSFIHNHAVVWDKGQLRDLGLLKGFPFGAAKAINDKGQAVGGPEVHYLPGIGGGMMTDETFLWQSGRMTYFSIKTPPAHIDDLTGINNKGEMVGEGFPMNAHSRHPLLWFKGQVTDIDSLLGDRKGEATGINDKGEIVGWALDDGPAVTHPISHAFLYRDGKMTSLLGSLTVEGESFTGPSWAYAINNKSQTVGNFGGCAALWENGVCHLLASFFDKQKNPSTAYAINNDGRIVGQGPKGAFLYQDGTFWDLNDLLPAGCGWVLRTARGINDRGQIVGSGQHDGKDRAFLLTPLKTP